MTNILADTVQEALAAAGTTNPREIAMPPSRARHGRAYLIEGEREGVLRRGWWVAGQGVEEILWYRKLPNGQWPTAVAGPV
jgi:hypothetical protein